MGEAFVGAAAAGDSGTVVGAGRRGHVGRSGWRGVGWFVSEQPRFNTVGRSRQRVKMIQAEASPMQSTSDNPEVIHAVPKNSGEIRIGHGYDLHRLEPGYKLILGGVELEHDRGCAGHSDGDAVLHCVVDSVLGALSLPDIGQLFSDKDPRWKGAPSDLFMKEAFRRMQALGFEIGNLDVTIILERPKLAPHKATIRKNIADLMQCETHRVNVKAKTHEKVDAVGENRAVEVHTVAILQPCSTQAKDLMPSSSVADSAPSSATEIGRSVERLYSTIESRRGADASSSWTAKLFAKGRGKIAQKVGEEATEVVIDAVAGNRENVVKESADLWYHLNVLWADMGITPTDVFTELSQREGQSGVSEKNSRSAE